MVERLRHHGYVSDARVAAALETVPRHLFLPPAAGDVAYEDHPVAIGHGQTISAPHMVAIMLEALGLEEGHRVLEVGGGSGYHAALASLLVRPGGVVWSVELVEELARRALDNLDVAGIGTGVHVVVGDGSEGLPRHAPFDRVFVSCAAPSVPPPLVDELAPGGRLLIPIGERGLQTLTACDKDKDGSVFTRRYGACSFVPMLGKHGFPAGA